MVKLVFLMPNAQDVKYIYVRYPPVDVYQCTRTRVSRRRAETDGRALYIAWTSFGTASRPRGGGALSGTGGLSWHLWPQPAGHSAFWLNLVGVRARARARARARGRARGRARVIGLRSPLELAPASSFGFVGEGY